MISPSDTQKVAPLSCPENDVCFASFIQLCERNDIVIELEGIENRDLRDGLTDPPSLLYVIRYAGSALKFLILTSIDDF